MTAIDDLADLREQRDFLLRSLEDLEREREAGDVDEHDYAALKDDYTARTAAVLRAIERGARPRRASRGPAGRRLATVAGVVAFAVLAGVLVAQAVGRRDPGDTATGDVRRTTTEQLNAAQRLTASGDFEAALAAYDEVLADDPDNAEAATYKGWTYVLADDLDAGLQQLLLAATEHQDYPDVHAFLAIVFFRGGLVEQAGRELDRFEALDPPPAIRELVAGLRAEIDAALGAATTTTP